MNTSTKIILWSVLALFLVVLFVVDLNKKNKNRQQNTQRLVMMAVLVALYIVMPVSYTHLAGLLKNQYSFLLHMRQESRYEIKTTAANRKGTKGRSRSSMAISRSSACLLYTSRCV